jgi:hypothetical protein
VILGRSSHPWPVGMVEPPQFTLPSISASISAFVQHPVAHQRLGNAADRWPMLIDERCGLADREAEEVVNLLPAFALQVDCRAHHDRLTPALQQA